MPAAMAGRRQPKRRRRAGAEDGRAGRSKRVAASVTRPFSAPAAPSHGSKGLLLEISGKRHGRRGLLEQSRGGAQLGDLHAAEGAAVEVSLDAGALGRLECAKQVGDQVNVGQLARVHTSPLSSSSSRSARMP